MIICSLDIESTGINQDEDQILSLGAVLEDTENVKPLEELPAFHVYINHNTLKGNIIAFSMNKHNIDRIIALRKEHSDYISKGEDVNDRTRRQMIVSNYYIDGLTDNITGLKSRFEQWLHNHTLDSQDKQIVIAGKQVARFDLPFLEKQGFGSDYFYNSGRFSKRTIDPSILYTTWKEEVLPSTDLCLKRSGIDTECQHDALQDAIDVIVLLRRVTKNYTISLHHQID